MLAFTLPSTVQRVINMCTALVVASDVRPTKINLVIRVPGEEELFLQQQQQNETNLYFFRQLLLCRVALGKSFLQFSAMKMAHAPPGHHSVIGRPSAGGLHFPEYVVYRGEQVICFVCAITKLRD